MAREKKEEKSEVNPITRLPINRSPTFEKLYATNFIGGLTSQDIRVEVINEKLKDEDGWCAISDALLIMTPRGAKRLQVILNESLKLYEESHGAINLEEEKEEELVY